MVNNFTNINKANNNFSPSLTELKEKTITYDVGNPINNLEADMNLCCDINDINDINNLEVDMNLCCEAVVAMIVW
jgi:hypothetical protein